MVGVFDRALAFGAPGNALFQDVALSTRTGADQPPIIDFVYGLGGRATPKKLVREAIHCLAGRSGGDAELSSPIYLGLRQ
jgi:pyruvate ferredoxin oxidoreductase alpha subunit